MNPASRFDGRASTPFLAVQIESNEFCESEERLAFMRILQVAPYFAPAYSYGGPPETVHKLCEALANRGHEVVVLTTDAFNSTGRQQVRHMANGLDVYYLRNVSNYLAWTHQLFLPLGI